MSTQRPSDARKGKTRGVALSLQLGLILALMMGFASRLPAVGREQVFEIAKKPLEGGKKGNDLATLIDDRVQAGDRETWIDHLNDDDERFEPASKEDILQLAMKLALARQVYCLTGAEAAAGWAPPTASLDTDTLEARRTELVQDLGQDDDALELRLDLRGDPDPDRDRGDRVQRGGGSTRVILTRKSLQSGVQRPGEAAPSAPGWAALQRALVRQLARVPYSDVGSGEWRDLEAYLWHLWQRCTASRLGDFGDARSSREKEPETGYPTRLFTAENVDHLRRALRRDRVELVTGEEIGQLGAHHLRTGREWLGGRLADGSPAVDREDDARFPRDDDHDEDDEDGVTGVVFTQEIQVTVSVKDHQAPRYARGTGELVLYAWVDWDNNGVWEPPKSKEPLAWKQVTPAQGNGGAILASVQGREARFFPNQWSGDSQTFTLTFNVPAARIAQGAARFRLFYFPAGGKPAKILPGGAALYGEVEDYRLATESQAPSGELGELIALRDPRGDLLHHSAGTPATAPASADLLDATAEVWAPDCSTLWSDCSVPLPGVEPEDGRLLRFEMELYEPIPEAPEAPFASWHFVVDLDGRRRTGHPGGESPVGVFPDLGVDLWADLIWDGHGFAPYLFLGAEGIAALHSTPGILDVQLSGDRRKVLFELPVALVEEALSELYGGAFTLAEGELRWVAVTNHAAGPEDFEDPPSDFFPDWLYLPEGSCARVAREGSGLCLADGRFKVEAAWETSRGRRGAGHGMTLTDEAGTFWFFDAANAELMVKMVDACGFNGRFWFFAAGLTDVEVELTVTDTASGQVRRYLNPASTPFAPIQDTSAFSSCGAASGAASGAGKAGTAAGTAPADLRASPTAAPAGETALALQEGRFRVDVAWETRRGLQGWGRGVPLTDESATFWFFDAANAELMVKVVDACGFNGHFWVFAAGLTDVEVELTVTDTWTGAVRRYLSPMGTAFAPLQDTGAFPTCP